jgi:hypothetical protein
MRCLSPAERSRLYSRIIGRIRRPRRYRIRIKGQQVEGLVKRGYLGTDEIGDLREVIAIEVFGVERQKFKTVVLVPPIAVIGPCHAAEPRL